VQPPQTPPTSADSAKLDHHTGAGQRLQLVIALGLGDSQPLFEQKPIAILTGAIDQYSKLIPVFSLLIVQFAPVSANTVGFGKSCGGIGGIKCDAGLWCDPRPGQCGQTDLKGRCVKVPTVCPCGQAGLRVRQQNLFERLRTRHGTSAKGASGKVHGESQILVTPIPNERELSSGSFRRRPFHPAAARAVNHRRRAAV